ncbi:MAG TPA: shikimate kinase [Dysgonomonas sp.]|nr:shikimate kinase [Dysgonomonas sp.]
MTRIFLIGYMGVGKTTLGRELAKVLNLGFIDLDLFIQNRYNKSISSIFEEEGEIRFREIENNILKEVAEFENVVVSTGGGVPCFYDNMEIMNKSGLTIYLKATPELLAERLNLCKDKRPLIKDKDEVEMLKFVSESLDKRSIFYNRAKLIFESDNLIDKHNTDVYVCQILEKINDYTQIKCSQ